jgi:multiple sugar transport system ATP-binding protein
MSSLTLSDVRKSFGKTEIIRGIDLRIEEGEFTVFVGPSGCGKSTLLRMIAGLEDITGGEIAIGDRIVNDVQASKRGVAMVFQSYALYPHLTVRENMGFGLKVRKMAAAEIESKVRDASATLRLDELLERYPRELSGGQRQRVAIGRAIVGSPDLFLFDEPLSNLDAELRVHMRSEIATLHKRLGNTMVYVTHDQIEAMTLADKIVVLRDGRIEQTGTPRELYTTPANVFVAQFIGSPKMNIVPFDVLDQKMMGSQAGAGRSTTHVGMRPEHLSLTDPAAGIVKGIVQISEYTGSGSLVHVEVQSVGTCLVLASENAPASGEAVGLQISNDDLHFFDHDGHALR